MLAELPVRNPGLTFNVCLERQRIDKSRPALMELDIVGVTILQSHAVLQRPALYLKCR